MRFSSGAIEMVTEGVGRIADVAGLLLLVVLGYSMFFEADARLQDGALAVGVIGVIAGAADRRTPRNIPVTLLAYVAIGLLSAAVHRWVLVSTSSELGWPALFASAFHLVVMALFIYGGANLLRTPMRLSWFVVLMVATTVVVALQIALDRATAGFVYVRFGQSLASAPHWGGIHGTSLALTLAFPLVSIGLAMRGSIWRPLASAILAAAFLFVAYVNGSRGGMVAMGLVAASIVLFPILDAASRRRNAMVFAAGGASLAIALIGTVWFLRGYIQYGSDLSGRTLMWQAAARMVWDHPWLGVGPGNYGNALAASGYTAGFPEGYVVGLYNAHNLLLHTTVETGVLGGICLLLFLAVAMRGCWRAWAAGYVPMVSLGILFALEGFAAHSLSENFFDARAAVERTRLIVWMFLAAALALDRLAQHAAASPEHVPSRRID
jgi:O-antigen ligase